MRNKFFKVLIFVIAVCMASSFLAGCGSSISEKNKAVEQAEDKTAQSSANAEPSKEKAASSVSLYCADFPEQAQQMMDEFMKKYPNISVDFVAMSKTPAEELQPKAAADALPDLMSINGDPFGALLADEGKLADVSDTDAWKNKMDALKGEWTSPKGIHFGISGGLCTTIFYYNKDLFKQAGVTAVPDSWEDFLAVCEQLKKAGITPVIWPGGDPNTLANAPLSYGLAQNIMSKDSGYKDKIKEGALDLNTKEMADIFAKIKALPDKEYVQKGFMSTDYNSSTQMYVDGKAAMIFQGTWLAGTLAMTENFDTGVFLPPWNPKGEKKVPVVSSETGFAVSARSKNLDAAIKLLEYINGEGYHIYQNQRMCVPHLKGDKIIGEVKLAPQVTELMKEVDSYNLTVPLYFSYMPQEFTGNIQKIMQEVLIGQKTPEQAAKQVDDIVKQAAKK